MISHLTLYADEDIMLSMSTKKTDLARALRTAFKASGMTRFELSKRSGVSYSVVHRFIGDDRDVTLRTASRLATVLGLRLVKGR